jgi:hypothetical protein
MREEEPVRDRTSWQRAWRTAHAVGAAGLLALAVILSLPARAVPPAGDVATDQAAIGAPSFAIPGRE